MKSKSNKKTRPTSIMMLTSGLTAAATKPKTILVAMSQLKPVMPKVPLPLATMLTQTLQLLEETAAGGGFLTEDGGATRQREHTNPGNLDWVKFYSGGW